MRDGGSPGPTRCVARCLALAGALLLGAPLAAAFEVLPVEHGDFAKPPGKVGATWTLTGEARVVPAPEPWGQAWALARNARLAVDVAVPAPREAQGVDPAGWYAVASVDVLGVVDGERAQLELVRKSDSGHKLLAKASLSVTAAFEDGAPRRLWLRLAPDALGGAETLHLELRAKGRAGVVVDDLRVERFHVAPTRALRGKENGVYGPDVLGAGLLGFEALVEHLASAFTILDVRVGGPADEAGLVVGDLVVAVEGAPLPTSHLTPGWEWFERSNEAVLGRALEAALRAERRELRLTVLRGDDLAELRLKLPYRAAPESVTPLAGPLRADLLAWTIAHQKPDGSWPGTDAVNPALGGLALLGTRDPAHAAAIRRCADWVLAKHPHPAQMTGLAYWTVAWHGMFLCEYFLASGDERARAWIEEACAWLPTTTHECKWGMPAWGHGPDGLPYDDKSLMAPTAHLLVFDALARRCGVDSKLWETVEAYVVHSWSDPSDGKGHGGMGYNASYKDKGEFWSRSGLVALAEVLRGGEPRMRGPLCALMEERHPWMLNSHAYGEPGGAVGLLCLAVAHRVGFDEVLPQWRWRFLVCWEPGYGLRYTTPHMGAPYMGEESIVNLAYAVLGAVETRGLVMAGGEAKRWLE